MNTAPINPEVLIVARESRGRTQEQVATAAGVTQGLISKAEHGVISTFGQDDLAAIAEYLEYPARLFVESGGLHETGSACLYHRKRKTLPAKVLKQLNARMNMRRLNVRKLMQGLDIEGDRTFHTLDPDEYGGSAVEVARALRKAWRIPEGPIPNLTALIESAGGIVIMEDFGTRKLFGMSCWTTRDQPLFFLNASMPTAELRWTMAHELGHLTMHGTPPEENPEEQADQFAGELLAPEGLFGPQVRRLKFHRLPQLKSYWRISMKAVITRAEKIGAIDKPSAVRLFKQHSARRYNTAEPYALSAEPPTLVEQAINVHLHDHDYSPDQLAEAVLLKRSEFVQQLMGEREPARGDNVVNLFPGPSRPSTA